MDRRPEERRGEGGRRGPAPRVRDWLPVLVYLIVIFSVSAQPNLKPPLSFENGDKLMHLLEYGGLGLLLARALRRGRGSAFTVPLALLALALASFTGAADEIFQRSVPGRQSSVFDWIADTTGAGLAQGLYAWLARLGWSWL